uniref:Uncharacterized protein n=1 Tax=Peronospora matthiolae TaxID=2874970 RepID=A0AAV1TB61_9STRA
MPDMPLEAVEPLLKQQTSQTETKADKGERRESRRKQTPRSSKAKPSPTDSPELLRAESSSGNESNVDPLRVSFLIFGGSEVRTARSSPELHPSGFDDVHGSEIRPVLQNKMPLFSHCHWRKRLRRGSAKSDPKERREYRLPVNQRRDELMQRKIEKSSEDGAETEEKKGRKKKSGTRRGATRKSGRGT